MLSDKAMTDRDNIEVLIVYGVIRVESKGEQMPCVCVWYQISDAGTQSPTEREWIWIWREHEAELLTSFKQIAMKYMQ